MPNGNANLRERSTQEPTLLIVPQRPHRSERPDLPLTMRAAPSRKPIPQWDAREAASWAKTDTMGG